MSGAGGAGRPGEGALEKTIFGFILRYSKAQQIWILAMTALIWPVLYLTLELPKLIINDAIEGEDFPRVLAGYEIDQVPYLMVLCVTFLVMVVLTGLMKYYINVYRGRLGERMLRRLRYELYSRVLRFPLPHFKRVSGGEIIPMITAEVEPVGGFVGDAYALPAFQGGMLTVYLGFIFVQDFFLGLAAIALYPLQIWLIPRLQAKVNELAKQRVRTVRYMATRIGETMQSVVEIHAHDGSRRAKADLASRLGRIYDIRYEIFRRKFAIKFINNFIAQLTPFFFYSVGGYFVIQGDLSFGAMVAVLAAYKDLASPWKELLRWYQTKEDVRIKYEQVVEQFAPDNMLDEALQDGPPETDIRLRGELNGSNVSFTEDGRVDLLDSVSFRLPLDKRVAVVGGPGDGKDELVQLAARLLMPTGGAIRLGDSDLRGLPESVTGRRGGYVGAAAFVFSTTIRDNLYFGLRHTPGESPAGDEESRRARERYIANAREAANVSDDIEADWNDYAAAGVTGPEALEQRALEVLRLVGMEDDLYALGLRGTIDPVRDPALAEAILRARAELRGDVAGGELAALIEVFDEAVYNNNATLGENLLFGTPVGEVFLADRMVESDYVQKVLRETGLYDRLLDIGYQIAETMVELFSGLAPGHEFFEQYSFIDSEELPGFELLLGRVGKGQPGNLAEADRNRLIGLSFKLVPARHRLGVLDDEARALVVEARHRFRRDLPPALSGAVEFFDSESYNAVGTIQDNILFGKLAYGQANGPARVAEQIAGVLDRLELRDAVLAAGLDFHTGTAGARLSAAQRQKLAIARNLIKRPDVLVLNEATRAMDSASQDQVMKQVFEEMREGGVIWSLHRASDARAFEQIVVLDGGRVVEQGTPEELDREGSAFRKLAEAD